jgi:hypothetical protein
MAQQAQYDGPETVFIHGGLTLFGLVLLDERGHGSAPWPWSPISLPMPPYLRRLEPGQVVTETLNFQVPPTEQAAGHTYDLWAVTSFSRPAPDSPDGPDNLWLHLETGPIPLQVTPPAPSQRLVAQLQADRDGWRLQVTDATGQTPPGPLWGELEAASPNAAIGGLPLRDSADGTWLEMIQMVNTERYESAGWGQAHYAPEARPVKVGQTTGYVIQRFDWWVLDWKVGDVGFELQAPVQAVSPDELLTIAASVQLSAGEEEK